MSCIKLPPVTAPSLGGGLSLTPPGGFGGGSFNASLCCKIPPVPIPPIPIPLPPVAIMLALGTLNTLMKSACDYINSLALDCPIE